MAKKKKEVLTEKVQLVGGPLDGKKEEILKISFSLQVSGSEKLNYIYERGIIKNRLYFKGYSKSYG